MVELINHTLDQPLAKYCNEGQEDWDVRLPTMLMAYRSAVQKVYRLLTCPSHARQRVKATIGPEHRKAA